MLQAQDVKQRQGKNEETTEGRIAAEEGKAMSEFAEQRQIDICLDETDFVIRSVAGGFCLKCGQPLIDRNGCYSPKDYKGDTVSNILLGQGRCAKCKKKVVCLRGHLGGEELMGNVHLANVTLRATGLYGDFPAPALMEHYDGDTHPADLALGVMEEMAAKPTSRNAGKSFFAVKPTFNKRYSKAHEPWIGL